MTAPGRVRWRNGTAGRRQRTTSAGSARRSPAKSGTTRRSRAVRPESILIVSVGILCLLGLVMVYSASSVTSLDTTGSTWSIVIKQAGWFVAGCIAAVFVSRQSLSRMKAVAGPLMIVSLAALAVLLVPGNPFAQTVNGATRWLGVGMFSFQPSELAKPALVLWLARFLELRQRDIGSADLLKPILIVTGVMGALVLAGDDLGTTMLLGVIMLAMLFLAGTPVRTVGGLATALFGVAAFSVVFLEQFRRDRLMAFINPETSRAAGYQLLQSQIGLASGGLFGSGPGVSRAKWGWLPEAHTDFILAVIGEELGLVGSVTVIVAFAMFMYAGCRIGLRRQDTFGRLVAFGVTTWIGVQALINIGVTVGTLPTKGITLPFVSYGGSSLMMSLIGVGVLLAVARDQ